MTNSDATPHSQLITHHTSTHSPIYVRTHAHTHARTHARTHTQMNLPCAVPLGQTVDVSVWVDCVCNRGQASGGDSCSEGEQSNTSQTLWVHRVTVQFQLLYVYAFTLRHTPVPIPLACCGPLFATGQASTHCQHHYHSTQAQTPHTYIHTSRVKH